MQHKFSFAKKIIAGKRVPAISVITALFALLVSPGVKSECLSDEAISLYVADYKARRITNVIPENITMEEAACVRRQLMKELPKDLGPITGYRLLFTNDAVRGMRGYDAPVWGAMFGQPFLPSPAKLAQGFGAIPVWEPDLLVEVKRSGLANARTPLEALRYLSAVVPYIDLKDPMFQVRTRAHFTAVNAAFRTGVVGKRIEIKPTKKNVEMLRKLSVEASVDGNVMSRSTGGSMMNGHPLNGLVWLAQELKKEGIDLQPGDLLSIGSFAAGQSVRPDSTIEVRYVGLPSNPNITVEIAGR